MTCNVMGFNEALGNLAMCQFGGMGGQGPCAMDCMP
jgi:hypothetical protein